MLDEVNSRVPARILIVEDEAIVAQDMALTVRDLGYQVVGPVSTGEEAIQTAEECKPDLILMDIRLGGKIDGIQASEQIRSRFDSAVIFLTAYEETDTISRARLTEPYGFLAKPFSLYILKSAIEMALYKHAADKRVRESEERYRTLVEQSIDGIALTQGTILRFANTALAKMFGFQSKEEMEGQDFFTFVAPEYRDLMKKRGTDRREGKSIPDCYEFMALRKDGTPFTAEVRVHLTTYHGKKASQGIVRDITDRKQAEEALRRSEERLELALKGADLGLWDYNLVTGQAVYNARRADMVGYSIEEAEPYVSWWWKQVHPEDVDGVMEEFMAHAEGRSPSYQSEHRLRHKSGEYIWILSRGKIVERDEDGSPVRIVGTNLDITARKKAEAALQSVHDELEHRVADRTAELRDANRQLREQITERKHAEETLREQRDFLQQLIDTIPAPIVYKDASGRYLGCNKAYEHDRGLSRADIVGRTVFDVHPHDLAEIYHEQDLSLLRSPGFQQGETQRRDAEGNMHEVMFTKATFSDSEGNVAGLVGVIMDITERKKAEEERERLMAQLLQAQKMEAVGTLAGGIAHDFNNLLTIIIGYTELMLSESTEGDPSNSDLQMILQTGRRGADLVQRLLTLTKKREINPQPINLNRLVEDSVALMERTFPKMIEIKTILEKDLGMVNADSGEIQQVLMNLCINAQEAMPEGGQLIIETRIAFADEEYCRLQAGAKPGPHVLIEITDTGKGMSNETMQRIFDPFFTTKELDYKKGTGLGLSVAKGIVEQHGGWITCDSEMDGGTTLRVYLPIIEDLPLEQVARLATDTVPGRGKILLIDDEEHVRDLGKRILERAGYAVITASNGREALDTYAREQSSIALIVLDLMMPQMSGQKCLEEILKINPHAKIIVSTGHSVDAQEGLRLRALARSFVNKPYEVNQMVQTVKQVLDESRGSCA